MISWGLAEVQTLLLELLVLSDPFQVWYSTEMRNKSIVLLLFVGYKKHQYLGPFILLFIVALR